jgi:CubicO group peptidase (beta-lactamase class C family)
MNARIDTSSQEVQRKRRSLLLGAAGALATGWPLAGARAQLRDATPREQSEDAAAFAAIQAGLAGRWTDVESIAVVVQGRVVFEFYRDGAPDRLRNVQSVEKSALSALVGIALARGDIPSLDEPVVSLVPDWGPLNDDPRSRQITVRHLLSLSAGFGLGSATSITGKLPPAQAWARPLVAAPGERYAYDNAIVPMLATVIERTGGVPLPDYARRHLVEPLGLAEPSYRGMLHLRTRDMARIGQLFLQQGRWDGHELLPADYVAAATRPQNAGGPPVSMPYGYLWWIVPGDAARRTFMASGYAGQLIWVHPPIDLVVAITSTLSADSQRRGHAVAMLREGLVAAAGQRAKSAAAPKS